MRQFRTVKSFNEQLHNVRLPKGAVCGCYQGITYYCDHLEYKRVVSPRNKKVWSQIHIHIWDDRLKLWHSGKNRYYDSLCEFVVSKIEQFGLNPKDVQPVLDYKSADVLPRQKMPQTYSGYQFRAGNMHNRTMTDADAMKPYRFNDEYGIKPTK